MLNRFNIVNVKKFEKIFHDDYAIIVESRPRIQFKNILKQKDKKDYSQWSIPISVFKDYKIDEEV